MERAAPGPGSRSSRRGRRFGAAATIVVALTIGLGCRPAARPPDVVLVVIDTLRADHLEAYGYAHQTAPNLTRLAERGALYERVVAPSSWTKSSMASLFTGRNPLRHGVMRPRSVLPAELSTLAGAFEAAGYQTLGVNTNPWLKREHGFARGFTQYESLISRDGFVDAEAVTSRALALWRDTGDRPVFLYVHYMDVHPPYSWRSQPPRDPVVIEGRGPLTDAQLETLYRKRGLDDPAAQQRVIALYDAGIREADRALGALLAGLDGSDRKRPRVVAVTSDHGEAFREHGTTEHGRNVYPEVHRVPLVIVTDDGITPGTRIATQVRSIDLPPTLLALAGAPAAQTFDGSPLPTRDGGEDRRAVTAVGFGGYAANTLHVGVVSGSHFFVRERIGDQSEFYDLRTDPGALRDLGPRHPEAAAYAAVERSLELHRADEHEATAEAVDAETREALRALGYVDP